MTVRDRQERAREIARATGCDALLVADPGNIWWLTGLAAEIATGPSPFAPGPFAVLVADEPVRLVVSDDQAPTVSPPGCELIRYQGFTTGPLRGYERSGRILGRLLSGRRVAADTHGLGRDLAQVANELLEARAIKDADELDSLRATLRATDAGQQQLRSLATPGMTEIELFGELRAAIEREAGEPTPLLADLVSGEGTAAMGGPPTDRVLGEGDLVLCDLAPRVRGAWGDSCATLVVGGEPSAEQRQIHARVREGLERAREHARPGVSAGALDALVRADLGYPHHTGHGIGGAYYEQPRIVPGAPTTLAPGMVIAIEPAHYTGTWGVRLEHVLLITADGAEGLSRHSLDL